MYKRKIFAKTIVLSLTVMMMTSVDVHAAALSDVLTAGVETTMDQTEDEIVLASVVAPSVVEGYGVLGVVTADSGYINIRESADSESDVVGKIAKNAICEVLASDGEWSEISSGDISGYISNDYLLKGASANERAEELISDGTELETALTLTEYKYGKGVTDIQMAVCEYALQYVGNPYVWGGTSLTRGADCSGFTLSVYRNFGVSLPHSSKSQAVVGSSVSLSEVVPGDLIFYGGKRIHHVALYIGNGQIVHACSKKTGIIVSSMYYNTPTKAVRVV